MRRTLLGSLLNPLIGGGAGLALILAASCGAAQAETLADAVGAAYATNPSLGAERARQRTYDEDYVQARATFGPTLGLTGQMNDTLKHIEDKTYARYKDKSDTSEWTLRLDQSLYNGGRSGAAVNAARAQILAGREYLRLVESQVVYDVISAYTAVLRDQDRVKVSRENLAALQAELTEARARFDVRQVTLTDVAQSEGRLLGAQAQLASYQAQLAISAGQYARVVGHAPGQLEPVPGLLELPATLDEALEAAEAANPELGRAKYAEQVSRARVAQAKGALRPTVTANIQYGYGDLSTFNNATSNAGSRTEQSLDSLSANVVVRIPLFQGGSLTSAVRQSVAQNGVDDMTIELTRRTALQNVVQAWNQLYAARSGLAAFEAQARVFLLAYEGVRREEPFGLRSRIEVLNAEQELQSAQLQLVNARYDEYVARAALLAATGRLTAESIDPKSSAYQPDAYFRAVHRKGALPWTSLLQGIDSVGLKPITQPAPSDLTDLIPTAGPAGLPLLPTPTEAQASAPLPSIMPRTVKP
jgi:TolC family type I secretion outer membrane protein